MMSASRESVAYKQYEERFPVKQEQRRDLRVAPAPRRRRRAGVRPSLVACIAILAVTSVYILFCQMQLTQVTAEVSKQSDTLDELAAENVALSTKQANSVDMEAVEEYAVNQLGMVKMDNSQIAAAAPTPMRTALPLQTAAFRSIRCLPGWRTAFPRLWNISGKGMNRIAYRGVRGGMLLTPYAFYGKVTVEE